MKDDTGLALYRKAGELAMPVGVMCFKGFGRHVKEIEALLASSPDTKVCIRLTYVSGKCTIHRDGSPWWALLLAAKLLLVVLQKLLLNERIKVPDAYSTSLRSRRRIDDPYPNPETPTTFA